MRDGDPRADIDQRLFHLRPRATELAVAGEAGTVAPEAELVLAVAVVDQQQRVAAGMRDAHAQSDRARSGRRHGDPPERAARGDQVLVGLEEVGLVGGIELELEVAGAILEPGRVDLDRGALARAAGGGIGT